MHGREGKFFAASEEQIAQHIEQVLAEKYVKEAGHKVQSYIDIKTSDPHGYPAINDAFIIRRYDFSVLYRIKYGKSFLYVFIRSDINQSGQTFQKRRCDNGDDKSAYNVAYAFAFYIIR